MKTVFILLVFSTIPVLGQEWINKYPFTTKDGFKRYEVCIKRGHVLSSPNDFLEELPPRIVDTPDSSMIITQTRTKWAGCYRCRAFLVFEQRDTTIVWRRKNSKEKTQ